MFLVLVFVIGIKVQKRHYLCWVKQAQSKFQLPPYLPLFSAWSFIWSRPAWGVLTSCLDSYTALFTPWNNHHTPEKYLNHDFYVSILFNLSSFLIFEPISYFSILYLMVSIFWYGLFFLNSGRKSVHKFHGWMAKYAPGTVLSWREYRRVSFRDGRLHFWK